MNENVAKLSYRLEGQQQTGLKREDERLATCRPVSRMEPGTPEAKRLGHFIVRSLPLRESASILKQALRFRPFSTWNTFSVSASKTVQKCCG